MQSTAIRRVWLLILCASIVIGILAKFATSDNFEFSLWSDRDLWRAHFLFDQFQVSGSELNGGGRTPGGFYYYLRYYRL